MTPQIGKTYRIGDTLLRCVKAYPPHLPAQPCVFQIVDNEGNDFVLYDLEQPGVVFDSGRRILFNRLDELELFSP